MNGGNLTNGNLSFTRVTLASGVNLINATTTNTGGNSYTINGGINLIQGTNNNGTNTYMINGGTNTISAILSGSGGVNIAAGTTLLSGSNNYAGNIILTGGALTSSNNNALGNNGNSIFITNSTLNIASAVTNTQNGVVLTNGTISGGGFLSLTSGINAVGGSNLISASLIGTGGLTNSGGTNTLSNSNNYTGGTVITGGAIKVSSRYALGSTTNITAISGNGILDLNSGRQIQQGLVTMNNGLVTNGALTNTIINTTGGTNVIAASLTGSSSLTNSGGTTTLRGTNNTYSNGTYVGGGILIVDSNSTLGANTGNTHVGNAGTLDLSGGTQVQSLLLITNGTVLNGNFSNTVVRAEIGTNIIDTALIGTSSLTIGSLSSTNNDGSSVTYLKNNGNSYTAGSIISGATLIVTNGGILGATTATTTLTNHSILNLGGSTQEQNSLIMGGCLASNGNISNTKVCFTAGTNTISANIIGTNSVISIGGTNILSGISNNYTGGTYITNSKIVVTANSSLGASTNSLSMSNATLDMSGETNSQGNISVNNSTITNGTLKGDYLDLVEGTNTITVDLQDNTTAFSVTNSGGVTIFSGSNSYSGNTTLAGGTLVVDSATALGNSGVNLIGGNLTLNVDTFARFLDWSTNSSIINIGTPGKSIVVGDLSFGDATSTYLINVTSLDNNTNLLASFTDENNLNINNLAIFGQSKGSYRFFTNKIGDSTGIYYQFSTNGNYYVTGTNSISGTFNEGNVYYDANSTLVIESNGILNVATNYVSTNSGTLNYQFTGNSNDLPRLNVTNAITLGGIFIGNFVGNAPQIGSKYQFATGSTITKNFNNDYATEVETNGINNPLLRGRIICQGDPKLYDLIAPRSYAYVAENQNQYSVASALNSFIPAGRGTDEYTVSVALDSLSIPEYGAAFNTISPALYMSMASIAISTAVNQYNEMVQRLAFIRAGVAGFSTLGFNDSPIIDDNKKQHSEKDILIPADDNHWGIFVDGNGVFANINNGNKLPGYSSESGGFIFGSDYKWNDTFSTGLYAGYEGMQTKQSGGNFICDNGSRFGAFGTYQRGGFYANAIAGGAQHSYQVNRTIEFTNFNRTANSAPTAGELDSLLASGYDVRRGHFTFGPLTSLQYTYFGLQPFTETGAQSLDLSVSKANASSLVYILGSHCLYDWKLKKDLSIMPQVSLGWQHEFLQNPYAINSSFSNGASFNYMSTTPQCDSLFSSVGVNINFKEKYDASFLYTASSCNPTMLVQGFNISLGAHF